MTEDFLVELFMPQSFDSWEICRWIVTCFYGFIAIGKIMLGVEDNKSFFILVPSVLLGFFLGVGWTLNRLRNMLEGTVIDSAYVALAIMIIVPVIPLAIFNKLSE